MKVFIEFLWKFILDEILFIINRDGTEFKLFRNASNKVWKIFVDCAKKLDPKQRMTVVFWAALGNAYDNYDELAKILNKTKAPEDNPFTSSNISSALNDAKTAISKCMRRTYFDNLHTDRNIRKFRNEILDTFFEHMEPDEIVVALSIDAIREKKHEEAYTYLDILWMMFPDKITATKKLSNLYLEHIEALIDRERYNEAVRVFNLAIKVNPNINIKAKVEKPFRLSIGNTIIKIRKIWDFFNKDTKIIIDKITDGMGALTFSEHTMPVNMVRGQTENSECENTIRQAVLEIDEQYMNIYTTQSTLVIQSDFDIDPSLSGENNLDIPYVKRLGQYTFHV